MSAPQATGWGRFQLGDMALALPMTALREVVPCGELLPLPCSADGVIGAMSLRGITVPVLDLRVLFGRPAAPVPCVVVVTHAGRLLGLSADGVSGIVAPNEVRLHRVHHTGPSAALFDDGFQLAGSEALVSVLSPPALAALPGVPWVEDVLATVRDRSVGEENAQHSLSASASALPVMLARCGRVVLAVHALLVHASIANPKVLPSPLALGACRGVVEYMGQRLPAVDLMAVCGLGPQSPEACSQAFVVRHPSGTVAYLVGEVLDVVRVQASQVLPVPAFALPRPELMDGSLSVEHLPGDLAERIVALGSARQLMVLSAEGLGGDDEMNRLASTLDVSPTSGASTAATMRARVPTAPAAPAVDRRSLIVYELQGEAATPVDQIAEILPFRPETSIYECSGELLGLTLHRGRSIPLMCLSRLTGGAPPAVGEGNSTLVVEVQGQPIGFVVPALRSIETVSWSPEAGSPGQRSVPTSAAAAARALVQIGDAAERRLVRLLDLQGLARDLIERRGAA